MIADIGVLLVGLALAIIAAAVWRSVGRWDGKVALLTAVGLAGCSAWGCADVGSVPDSQDGDPPAATAGPVSVTASDGPGLIPVAAHARASFFCPGIEYDADGSAVMEALMRDRLTDPNVRDRDPRFGGMSFEGEVGVALPAVEYGSSNWNYQPVPSDWAEYAEIAYRLNPHAIAVPTTCPQALLMVAVVSENAIWAEDGPMLHAAWAWRP